MTNEVVAVNEQELNELAALTGANASDVKMGGDYIQQLKINMEDEDEDGKPLKKGYFFITGFEKPVYAKNVVIRPLMQRFQWTNYSQSEKKTINRTVLVTKITDEAVDELGTVKCGKPSAKAFKDDPSLKETWKDIKTNRRIYVLVDYDGETVDGEKVKVENAVAVLSLKGSNFSPFQEEFIDKLPKNARIWDFKVTLGAERKKEGTVVYYVIHYETDFSNRSPIDSMIVETIKAVNEQIEAVNRDIRAKHIKAIANRDSDDVAIDALKAVNADLESDLKDDVPFDTDD